VQGRNDGQPWHNVLDVIKAAFQTIAPEEASRLMRLLRQKMIEHDTVSDERKGSKRRRETKSQKRS
jgi:hypothetical protein